MTFLIQVGKMSNETREIVLENLLSFMKTFRRDLSNSQKEARMQLIKLASGRGEYEAPAQKLTDEQVLEFFDEIGIRRDTKERFFNSSFEYKDRASTSVQNDEIVESLDKLLYEHSVVAHRSNDVKSVPGHDEKVRARVMMLSFRVVFQMFNDIRAKGGKTKVGERQLYEIVNTRLTMYRQPRAKDRSYAECGPCSKFKAAANSIKRNVHLKSWKVSEESLLSLSVCDQDNSSCMSGMCSACQPENIVDKIKDTIPNYKEIMEQNMSYNILVQYSKSG